MTSFVVLTAVWKRPSLTELVLRSHLRNRTEMAGEVEVHFLAVGSEGETSRALCRDCGFDYVEHPNAPLSYKWNAGVRAAEAYRPDAVVIVGSDAFLSPDLLPTYAEKLSQGFDFFGFRDLFFYDPSGPRLGYWGGYDHSPQKDRTGEPIGCGRCFSRKLLDRMGWNLWPREPRVDTLLDRLALNFTKVHGFRPSSWNMEELGLWALEVKAGLNLTPFDAIEYRSTWHGDPARERVSGFLREDEMEALRRIVHQPGTEAG